MFDITCHAAAGSILTQLTQVTQAWLPTGLLGNDHMHELKVGTVSFVPSSIFLPESLVSGRL